MQELKNYVQNRIIWINIAVIMCELTPGKAFEACILKQSESLYPSFPNRKESFHDDLNTILTSMHHLMKYPLTSRDGSAIPLELEKYDSHLVNLCKLFIRIHS